LARNPDKKGKYHFEAATKYCGGLAYADGAITVENGFNGPGYAGDSGSPEFLPSDKDVVQ
jgi:hypothetical protein